MSASETNPKLFDDFGTVPTYVTELTLRDLFAMAALAGYVSKTGIDADLIAKDCWGLADAMLAARTQASDGE
jgi:hypothetical protein